MKGELAHQLWQRFLQTVKPEELDWGQIFPLLPCPEVNF